MRYVLGPSFAYDLPVAPEAPGALVDVYGDLIKYDAVGATLRFPAFDPATHQAPAEIKLFLVPEGQPTFSTADEYLASEYPVATQENVAQPEGVDVVVAHPSTPGGKYLGQVVFGYAV